MKKPKKVLLRLQKELPGTLLFVGLVLAMIVVIGLQDDPNVSEDRLESAATAPMQAETRLVDSGGDVDSRVE